MKWILLILFLLYFFVCGLFFNFAFSRSFKLSLEKMMSKNAWMKLQESRIQIQALDKEDVVIESLDGLKLTGHFIKAKNEAKRTIIMCHGWRSHWEIDFIGALLWFHEDSDLLVIEQRAQGNSEGKYMTFGSLERLDINKWVDYCKEHDDKPLYLYGTSMGAASCLMASSLVEGKVQGIISDSGFINAYEELADFGKRMYHAPKYPIMPGIQLLCKFIGHFDLVNDIEVSKNIPIIHFQGTKDTFVDVKMVDGNKQSFKENVKVVIFENVGHCAGFNRCKEMYQTNLIKFFNDIEVG